MSDRWNLFFVYEIRQIVRNRTVAALICLYLFAQAGLLGKHFIDAFRFGNGWDFSGPFLAAKTVALLYVVCSLAIPFYSVVSTIRQDFEEELLRQTPIDWYTAACGKFQVATLLNFLFYAATLPFLTVAWMLRGVDILSLTLWLGILFMLTLTFHYYLVAAFVRCKDWKGVMSALSGLFGGGLPWLIVWGSFYGMTWDVLGAGYITFKPTSGFGLFLLWFFLFILSSLLFSGSIFKDLWPSNTSVGRATRVAFAPWLSVLLSAFFTGMIAAFFYVLYATFIEPWL